MGMNDDLRKRTIVLAIDLAIMAIGIGCFVTGITDLASCNDEYMRMYYNHMIPDCILTHQKGMASVTVAMLALMMFIQLARGEKIKQSEKEQRESKEEQP